MAGEEFTSDSALGLRHPVVVALAVQVPELLLEIPTKGAKESFDHLLISFKHLVDLLSLSLWRLSLDFILKIIHIFLRLVIRISKEFLMEIF